MSDKCHPDKSSCYKFAKALQGSRAVDPDYNGYGIAQGYYIYDRDGFLDSSIDYCPWCGNKLIKEKS